MKVKVKTKIKTKHKCEPCRGSGSIYISSIADTITCAYCNEKDKI